GMRRDIHVWFRGEWRNVLEVAESLPLLGPATWKEGSKRRISGQLTAFRAFLEEEGDGVPVWFVVFWMALVYLILLLLLHPDPPGGQELLAWVRQLLARVSVWKHVLTVGKLHEAISSAFQEDRRAWFVTLGSFVGNEFMRA
ncbi:MAG: hypothetical protein ACP5SI_07250, partial [Chloroflexia bacterium]